MRLFDDLMTWQPPGSEVVWSAVRAPINVTHTDEGAAITVDMPGVDPQDLELTFDNGALMIAGKRGEQVYRYNVALGDTIDPSAIEAQLDKGVLTVRARKHPEAKPRKIPITTGKTLSAGDSK
ncbi:MAG: Hsp20/alpha crystallin family protein [Kofleriaceae bacterium]|nr:Hsp20/alpha crystallin family protein [Kofleriaceae bacterium]